MRVFLKEGSHQVAYDKPGVAMGSRYRNTAKGNAHVGVQIGRMDGALNFHADQPQTAEMPDLAAEISLLRERIEAAIREGLIDDALVDTARSSMSAVEKVQQAPGDVAEKKPRFIAGLTALAASVAGLARLSDAVGALIDSVAQIG